MGREPGDSVYAVANCCLARLMTITHVGEGWEGAGGTGFFAGGGKGTSQRETIREMIRHERKRAKTVDQFFCTP
ncbi:MAG: hypothetical protein HPY90_01365 [Syntrophothermus sp.]|uniref:hypothetical protein n=1 Tax=Syntrophothermus sp. TaxID=2736299 RepID=UPI00257FB2C8|nr:hypothetical protein [Syntrophothermus sp.]NSW81913.1 hypothetical protein [Syntrophothermus sp.]